MRVMASGLAARSIISPLFLARSATSSTGMRIDPRPAGSASMGGKSPESSASSVDSGPADDPVELSSGASILSAAIADAMLKQGPGASEAGASISSDILSVDKATAMAVATRQQLVLEEQIGAVMQISHNAQYTVLSLLRG